MLQWQCYIAVPSVWSQMAGDKESVNPSLALRVVTESEEKDE